VANPDYEFLEGFDIYGPLTDTTSAQFTPFQALLLQRWTSLASSNVILYAKAALSGTGLSLHCQVSGAQLQLNRSFPGNYARFLGGVTFSAALDAQCGLAFGDNGTDQIGIFINPTTGKITVQRGGYGGTVLATSAESVAANSVNYLAWDITINNSTGIVKIWLNNVLTSINLTGQNTRQTANNYVNAIKVVAQGSWDIDHLFFWGYTAAGGSELPPLDSPIIQTDFPTADSTVAFTKVAGVLGGNGAYPGTFTVTAPGANTLALRPYTAEVSGTLASVSFLPSGTSASAKMKPVVYADLAGAPGALLSTGAEVVGTTFNVVVTMPLTTPQTLAAGTQYWIGFITDTSVTVQQASTGTAGYQANNTYASGAPVTAPAMTSGRPSWVIYGNVTSPGANFGQVNENPNLGLASYNSSSTVSQEDLFTFPNLAINSSAIYTVGVIGCLARSDSGARTANLRCKSVSTESSGSNAGQSPPTSFAWLDSNFKTDPNTGSAWAGAAAVNAAKYGYQVAA